MPRLWLKGVVYLAVVAACATAVWHLTPEPTSARLSVLASGTKTKPKQPHPSSHCKQPNLLPAKAPPKPRELGGILGLYVARFDAQTLQPLSAVATYEHEVFPLASTYKQAVLWSALSEMDAGRLSESERFDVSIGQQSLGDYPFDGSSISTLFQRMIQNSDNTATDLLHRRIGLEKPQKLADRLGLCKTRLLLPTKDWWVAQAGLGGPAFPAHDRLNATRIFAKANRAEQLRLAQLLDQKTQTIAPDDLNDALNRYFEGPDYNPEIDLNTQNASTPFEWANLMAYEFLGKGLSARRQKTFETVMNLGVGKGYLQTPFVHFGAKTGNGWRILTLSGYIKTDKGEDIVYVLFNKESPKTYTVGSRHMRAAFRWINESIQKVQQLPRS